MITQEQFNQTLAIMFRKGVEFGWGNNGMNANQAYMEALAEIKATVFSESETPKKD